MPAFMFPCRTCEHSAYDHSSHTGPSDEQCHRGDCNCTQYSSAFLEAVKQQNSKNTEAEQEETCFCGCGKERWRVIASLETSMQLSGKEAADMYNRAKANAPRYLKGTVTT